MADRIWVYHLIYIYEAYLTFSHSLIHDDSERVVSTFQSVTEPTEGILNKPRLFSLKDLATNAITAQVAADACRI